MRASFASVVLLLLAGCTSPTAHDDPSGLGVDAGASAPEPVGIHDVVKLTMGVQRGWGFDLAPGAKLVEIRFYGTGPASAPLGGGQPLCLSFTTPDGSDAAGVCQGSGVGNLQVSPYVVAMERVFYHKGSDATPGHYEFSLDAQPSATEFHAVVTIQY